MAVAPYPIQCYRHSQWIAVQSDELPTEILFLLAHTSTKLCCRENLRRCSRNPPSFLIAGDTLDVDGMHKNTVLFSGTKVLQANPTGQGQVTAATPEGGRLGLVSRTDFGHPLLASLAHFQCQVPEFHDQI
ncbi:hypothetical protein EV424DRAFT_1351837 [Suillus variegatus]|nr:hypothetical protein EV424DRAFT_1351837 [Suillus variegatus]